MWGAPDSDRMITERQRLKIDSLPERRRRGCRRRLPLQRNHPSPM